MASLRGIANLMLNSILSRVSLMTFRSVSSTSALLGRKRKVHPLRKWGLEPFPVTSNFKKCRILEDFPDYTYLDGRPTPLTEKQLEFKEKNYKFARQIVELSREIEEAEKSHLDNSRKERDDREAILNAKLMPKSQEL